MRKMILAAMALVAATAVHARNEAVMLPLADGRLLPVLEDWTPRTRFGTFITAMTTPDRLRVARNRALVGFLQEGLG